MKTEVEISQLKGTVPKEEIERAVIQMLEAKQLHKNTLIGIPSGKFFELNHFESFIQSVAIASIAEKFDSSACIFHYFEFSDHTEPETEIIENNEEQISASTHWILPSKSPELHGLWESLVYDDNLKEDLLDFSKTIMLFSNLGIDPNIVACNRLVLLHGPPGTGKTSLAKALAQKLSIQMYNKYQFTHLFEINSHSLFSRWFSESGKLVMKMFQQIQDIIEIPGSLVVVLIDEVESIAFARGNISTNEPSDSVRVVNSVLTQLDKIKKYPNVLVITTSNLTQSIDLAFLDRADIVKFLGYPSVDAIYKIISSAVVELVDKGLIVPDSEDDGRDGFNIFTIENYERFHDIESFPPFSTANIMSQVCKEAVGISGRGLRKLPFLAHALYLKKDSATLREFMISMRFAVEHAKKHKENIGQFNRYTVVETN